MFVDESEKEPEVQRSTSTEAVKSTNKKQNKIMDYDDDGAPKAASEDKDDRTSTSS